MIAETFEDLCSATRRSTRRGAWQHVRAACHSSRFIDMRFRVAGDIDATLDNV
jgi:hypothetical protein